MEEKMVYWFAMKVFFNKVFEIEDYFQTNAVECYVPVRWKEKVVGGKRVKVREPAISSLIFFRTVEEIIPRIERDLYQRVILYKYRQSHLPARIPDREMEIFKMVTSMESGNWDFVDADILNFSINERVRVTGGEFEGAEGYIKRIKGNRRLVVAIEGIVAVATTYIPSCYLEKIEKKQSS